MHRDLSRRMFLAGLGAATLGCSKKAPLSADPATALAEIESRIGGRLGVYALDTGSGAILSHRGAERFAMCSTFKWALVAAVLVEVDRGKLGLTQAVEYGEKDLLDYAPITRKNVGRGRMTIQELAQATITVSDNTAANLLLDRVGGPPGLTRFFRAHGDTVTRLDRNEPMLNTNLAGDARDTTTPEAMVSTMRALLTTAALSPASRERLIDWMVASQTGTGRIRAGLPAGWRAGDKTGTCEHGAVNDVAIAWPPGRPPVLMAVSMSDSRSLSSTLTAAHAEVGRVVSSHWAVTRVSSSPAPP